MLTDIESSTRLWETQAAAMERAIGRHGAIIADAVARNGGTLIRERGEGDSTFSVFPHAPAAVAAALAMQRGLTDERWESGAELRVRIAMHTGDAYLIDDEEYASPVINRCARIREVAYGGQVLVSEHTVAIVERSLPGGASLRDLGPHRLRDLSKPVRIFQLSHPDLPEDFPKLRSLEAGLHNLPIQLTSFIGREKEAGEIRKHLSATRILNLTGPGGIGKTRLALQVAGDVVDAYPDGVWFVDLSAVASDDLVPQALAQALSLREERGRSVTESVIEHLRTANALIAFDNCEHLIDATSAFATTLLRSCVELSILATGREPLHVPGATTWRVPAMATPDDAAPTEALGTYESIRLFTERAGLVRQDFALSHETGPIVARICRKLDGVPLAIELAAANVAAMSVGDIESRLDDRFRTLVHGGPDVPRHETLLATVDWSHDLLNERERICFRRLSVFAGGFSLEGAEAVCSDEPLVRSEVVELVTRLVDKSLIVLDDAIEQTRYGMLETIREYAWTKLAESGEIDAVIHRHSEHFTSLAERIREHIEGPDQVSLLDQCDAEHDNFRRALRNALERDHPSALRLSAALGPFWSIRGFWTEGVTWLNAALQVADGADPTIRSSALMEAGNLALDQSRLEDARRVFEQNIELQHESDARGRARAHLSLANALHALGEREQARSAYTEGSRFAQESGDARVLIGALGGLGTMALSSGEFHEAERYYDEAIRAARGAGMRWLMAIPLTNLAMTRSALGDAEQAETAASEALEIARETGDRKLSATLLSVLGDLALQRGDHDSAASMLGESLGLQREIGDGPGEALSLHRLGELAVHRGELGEAQTLLDESFGRWQELGMSEGVAFAQLERGRLARRLDRPGEARALVAEAASIFGELGQRDALVECLEVLAGIAGSTSDPELAGKLFGAADAARQASGSVRSTSVASDVDRDLTAIGLAIGDAALERATSEGRELSLEAALSLATGDQRPGM